MHDTWAARDLPVLDATVSLLEQSFMVTVTDISVRTGLEPSDVARALEAMDPVYVDFRKTTTGGDARFWYVFKVTPEARRVVGQWPTAQALADRLAQELTAAARRETDGERQGLLTYAARLIGDTLRDATVQAAAKVLGPAFGGVPRPELGTPLPAADALAPRAEAGDAPAPETAALETAAPVVAQPEAPAPATAAPEAPAPATAAPEATSPATAAAEATAPEATSPGTTAPATTAPATTAPATTWPVTTAPQTAAPQTAAPQTTAPDTTAPQARPQETTGPELEPLPEAATFPSALSAEPAAGSSRTAGA